MALRKLPRLGVKIEQCNHSFQTVDFYIGVMLNKVTVGYITQKISKTFSKTLEIFCVINFCNKFIRLNAQATYRRIRIVPALLAKNWNILGSAPLGLNIAVLLFHSVSQVSVLW